MKLALVFQDNKCYLIDSFDLYLKDPLEFVSQSELSPTMATFFDSIPPRASSQINIESFVPAACPCESLSPLTSSHTNKDTILHLDIFLITPLWVFSSNPFYRCTICCMCSHFSDLILEVLTAEIPVSKVRVQHWSTNARKDWLEEMKVHPEVIGRYITLFMDETKNKQHVCGNKTCVCLLWELPHFLWKLQGEYGVLTVSWQKGCRDKGSWNRNSTLQNEATDIPLCINLRPTNKKHQWILLKI